MPVTPAPRSTDGCDRAARSPRTRPPRRLVAWLLVWCLAAVTCVALPAPSPAGGAPTPTAAALEPFPGTVDEFYEVPDPLPPGAPGELIRVQVVGSEGGRTTVRVMYHSRDASNRDRAVTGIITYPEAPAPAGGRPVVALSHGTTGMATQCAPSRSGGAAPTFGADAVAVATDYVGLGPVGEVHPYLSRPSEAYSVVDSVRAARNLLGTDDVSDRWLVVGASQGGHAAIATNELGQAYAPELTLLGAVAIAPGAVFDQVYGGADVLVATVITFMMLVGAAGEHPSIELDHYLAPASTGARQAIENGCLNDIIAAVLAVPIGSHYLNDPAVTEPARSILLSNDVGLVAAPSPLLVVAGTADTTVHIDRARELFRRLCVAGQRTEYTEYEGADHGNIGFHARAEIQAWVAARLAGLDAGNACPEPVQPPPSSSTTTTTTSAPPAPTSTTSTTVAAAGDATGDPSSGTPVGAPLVLAESTPARARTGSPAFTG